MVLPRRVGILLFNEVEVLDFAGPFEVFSLARTTQGEKAFEVHTVAQARGLISARNGLKVQPDCSFADAENWDIVIIPGGYGAEEVEIHNPDVIRWIKKCAEHAQITASVCTGAFLLAEAGLLDGRQATTHWMDIGRLEGEYPDVQVLRGVKYVDSHPVITSGGISAGIHMSLYLVRKLLGEEVARATAKRMEYEMEF